jgi:hypothetical protein
VYKPRKRNPIISAFLRIARMHLVDVEQIPAWKALPFSHNEQADRLLSMPGSSGPGDSPVVLRNQPALPLACSHD